MHIWQNNILLFPSENIYYKFKLTDTNWVVKSQVARVIAIRRQNISRTFMVTRVYIKVTN